MPKFFLAFAFLLPVCLQAGEGDVVEAGTQPLVSAEEVLGLPEPGTKSGCVLMNDGRTYVGEVTAVSGGYEIQFARGRFVVPFDQVRLTATTLDEAYAKQHEQLKNGTATEIVTLSRWCFEQKLYEEARTECLQAIRLEPNRADLRQLLLKIDGALGQANVGSLPALPMTTASGSPRPPVAGITPRTNADFIRHVQPLLMNTCANAACHAAKSETDFRLMAVRPGQGSQRYQSQHNLEQVLRQLTPPSPEASPLLTVPQDRRSSKSHAGIFEGRKGMAQRDALQAWIVRACGELNGPGKPAPRVLTAAPRIRERSLVIEPQKLGFAPSEGPMEGNATIPALHPEEIRQVSGTTDEELLQGVRQAALPDAFDPDEFNAAVHGVPVGQSLRD